MIKVWSTTEKKEILSFKAHKNWIRTVSFSFDNQFILTGADDGCVKIWDLNGFQVNSLNGHSSWVLTAAFSRDGEYVVSGSNDRVVLLWKVGKDNELKSFRGFTDMIHSVSFSINRKYVVVELIKGDMNILKI